MLEIIGFIAIAYLIIKFAPEILEMAFKFAVVCIGVVAFIFLISFIWGSLSITFS